MNLNPKYNLHQKLIVKSMGINFLVEIIKREALINCDTEKVEYLYDFIYRAGDLKDLDWRKVDEETLDLMIQEAK